MRIVLSVALSVLAVAQQPAAPPQASGELPNCPDLVSALRAVSANDTRLRDWANLNRYREAHHGVAPPAAGEPRGVPMGDSITANWQGPGLAGSSPGSPTSTAASAARRRRRC